MRGSNLIQHRPYIHPLHREKRNSPFICRLAPSANGFELEWLDLGKEGSCMLYYGVREEEKKECLKVTESSVKVSGLETDCDYELYLETAKGARSMTRLVRTGTIPKGCTVINYLHPEDDAYDFSGKYLCSPSLSRVKSGRLIAGMDLYGHHMAQNLTLHFYSDDDGKTWHYMQDLYPFYWSTLFVHKDVLYMLGLTTEYGNLQIACSADEGQTWSAPVTLFYGSNVLCRYGGFHRAPMHVVPYQGKLYTTCEYGSWEAGAHLPAILSVDLDADLMDPQSWNRSEHLFFEGKWKEKAGTIGDTMEGNIVPGKDGCLYSYLRWKTGSLLKLKVNAQEPDKAPEFVDIIEAPVTNSMFRIIPIPAEQGKEEHSKEEHSKEDQGREEQKKDQVPDKYYMISNRRTPAMMESGFFTCRNVLSLCETNDLEHFQVVKDIVNAESEDPGKVGFQYPVFLYEEGKLSLVIRSAFNNANSAHDSNYMLFYQTDV